LLLVQSAPPSAQHDLVLPPVFTRQTKGGQHSPSTLQAGPKFLQHLLVVPSHKSPPQQPCFPGAQVAPTSSQQRLVLVSNPT